MKIPVHYYYQRKGVRGVVRISSHWMEESSGFQNEHINERITCKDNDKFYVIRAHRRIKTMGGDDFDIIDKDEITEDEYNTYRVEHGGILDTKEYRIIFDQITKTEQKIENSYPSCPKCDAVMTEKTGRYGAFWGCSGFPNCDGTRKLGDESAKIKELWRSLKRLNQKLNKLEK